jgi:hypothetical protein
MSQTYTTLVPMHCYFCKRLVEDRATPNKIFCFHCAKQNGLREVATFYGKESPRLVNIFLKSEDKTYWVMIVPDKYTNIYFRIGKSTYSKILSLPHTGLTPQNIKAKLSLYLTFL